MRQSLIWTGWFALALNGWITYRAVWGPNPLPERIATHFDAAGNPNGWGPPAMLLLLPVIGAVVFGGVVSGIVSLSCGIRRRCHDGGRVRKTNGQ